MGEVGKCPLWYEVLESLPILNCSIFELLEQEDWREAVGLATAYKYATSMGEQLKQTNPVYHKKVKELQNSVEKARGK